MKKYKIITWVILLTFNSVGWLTAQNEYHIRLQPLTQANVQLSCYEVQLASANQTDVNLAGQNYRMYYNSAHFYFSETATKTLLMESQYTELVVKDNLIDIDALGTGVLPFEANLGFVNFGNDLDNLAQGGIILPASGDWISTAQVCYDKVNPTETMPMELVWARPELTAPFATAYVEMSEWTEPFKTNPINAASYDDMLLSTSVEMEFLNQSVSIFPNPTSGKTMLNYRSEAPLDLTLFSINGARIEQALLPKGKNSHSLDLSKLPVGTYLIKLTDGTQTFTKKIEKIH